MSPDAIFQAALIGGVIAAFQNNSTLHQNARKDRLMDVYVDNILSLANRLSERARQLQSFVDQAEDPADEEGEI